MTLGSKILVGLCILMMPVAFFWAWYNLLMPPHDVYRAGFWMMGFDHLLAFCLYLTGYFKWHGK